MNYARRSAERAVERRSKQERQQELASDEETLAEINRRVDLARSPAWAEIHQRALAVAETYEVMLHTARAAEDMWRAQGAVDALVTLIAGFSQAEEELAEHLAKMRDTGAVPDPRGSGARGQ